MGCLKSLITKILIILGIVAFFYFGGVKFTSDLIKKWNNPPRDEAIKSAQEFGDFENIESDYKIGRTFKTIKYNKMTVKHAPSGQKITFVELPKGKTVEIPKQDLNSKDIEEKLQNFINNSEFKGVEIEDIKIIKTGSMPFKSTTMEYADFIATIKKPLRYEFKGFVGVYEVKGEKDKDGKPRQAVVFSARDKDKYSEKIVKDLLQTVDLN